MTGMYAEERHGAIAGLVLLAAQLPVRRVRHPCHGGELDDRAGREPHHVP